MQKADGQLLGLIEHLPLCVSSEFDSNQAFCDLPLPLLLIAASSELRKISPALPAERCLHQGVKSKRWHCPSTRAWEAPVSCQPSNFITQQAAEIDFGSPAVSKGKITFLLDFWLSAN